MTYQSPSYRRQPTYRNRPTTPPVPIKHHSLLYRLMTRKEFLATVGSILLGVLVFRFIAGIHHHALAPVKPNPATPTTTTTQAFNKSQYSLSNVSSLWVVVNKHRPLNPLKYVPAQLVVPNVPLRNNITSDERQVSAVMAPALESMVQTAAAQNIHLNLQSGYRSYDFQVSLFNSYVKEEGQATAEQQSAHAGYSEHQTGLAADLGGTSQPSCNVEQCYATTTEGQWLAANAYQYGFIVRYPADKQAVTGYEYEPWHVRYVGVDLATEMHKQGVETLEEFFSLGATPDYN